MEVNKMEEQRIRKLVGRDTKPPATSLRKRDDVVAAYEDVYTELFNLARGIENEPSERIKALSECRRVLADLLVIHKPVGESPEEEQSLLKNLFDGEEAS
jgi:hypothetical protein